MAEAVPQRLTTVVIVALQWRRRAAETTWYYSAITSSSEDLRELVKGTDEIAYGKSALSSRASGLDDSKARFKFKTAAPNNAGCAARERHTA